MALTVISLKWVHREVHGKPPSPRQGHSVGIIGDVAYIFGGIRSVEWPKKGTYFFRDLHQLHLYKRLQWEKVKQSGEIPKGRFGHHMCVIDHKIYLLGGKHELHADRCLPGLHVFDTETKSWSKVQTSGTEPVAHGSTAAVVANRIYVVGGLVDGQATSDVHCFDSDCQWWVKLTVTGIPPSPRCDAASSAVDHRIYIFGGAAGADHWFNDIHVFNTERSRWRRLNRVEGEPPSPRGNHTFLTHSDKDVYVFGGSNDSNRSQPTCGDLYKFSLGKCKWKRPFFSGCPPARRSGHAALIHKNKLIIIGGCNEDTDFNDVHIAKLINPSKRQPLRVSANHLHEYLSALNNPPTIPESSNAIEAHFHERLEPGNISSQEDTNLGSEPVERTDQVARQHSVMSGVSVTNPDSNPGLQHSSVKSVRFEETTRVRRDPSPPSSQEQRRASPQGGESEMKPIQNETEQEKDGDDVEMNGHDVGLRDGSQETKERGMGENKEDKLKQTTGANKIVVVDQTPVMTRGGHSVTLPPLCNHLDVSGPGSTAPPKKEPVNEQDVVGQHPASAPVMGGKGIGYSPPKDDEVNIENGIATPSDVQEVDGGYNAGPQLSFKDKETTEAKDNRSSSSGSGDDSGDDDSDNGDTGVNDREIGSLKQDQFESKSNTESVSSEHLSPSASNGYTADLTLNADDRPSDKAGDDRGSEDDSGSGSDSGSSDEDDSSSGSGSESGSGSDGGSESDGGSGSDGSGSESGSGSEDGSDSEEG